MGGRSAWKWQSRLPPMDAALRVMALSLEIFRDTHGMRACMDRSIGAMRKRAGAVGENPRELKGSYAQADWVPNEIARDETRVFLAGLCRVCPVRHCAMKSWGMN